MLRRLLRRTNDIFNGDSSIPQELFLIMEENNRNNLADFSSYYTARIQPYLEDLAKKRIEVSQLLNNIEKKTPSYDQYKLPCIIILVAGFIIGQTLLGIIIIIILQLVVRSPLWLTKENTIEIYREEYRQKILTTCAEFFHLQYNYHVDKKFDWRRFKYVGIISTNGNAILHDLFVGEYKAVNLMLAHATVITNRHASPYDYTEGDTIREVSFKGIKKRRLTKKDVINTELISEKAYNLYSKITPFSKEFCGLLLIFKFQKSFLGRTIAIAQWSTKGLPGFCNNNDDLESVELEDSQFNKIFKVYSSDQVEARYLFTPEFMERLLELSDLFNTTGLCCAFDNGQFLLALPYEDYIFTQGDLRDSEEYIQKATFQSAERINSILQIIDVLKLR